MNTSTFKKLATFEQGARISNGGLTIDNGGITVTAGLSYLKGGLKVSGNSGNGYALNVSGSGKVTGSLTASTLDISSTSLTSIKTAGGIQAANTIWSTGGDVKSSNGSSLNSFLRCHNSDGTVKLTDPACARPETTGPTLTLTCNPGSCQDGDFNVGNYAQAQVSVFANYSCQGTCSVSWSTDGSLGIGTGTQTQKTWTLTSTGCGWRTKNGNVTVTVTDSATGISKTASRYVSLEVETGGC